MKYKLFCRKPNVLTWMNPESYPANKWIEENYIAVSFELAGDYQMDRVFELRLDCKIEQWDDSKNPGIIEDATLVETTIMEWRYTSEDGRHVHSYVIEPEPIEEEAAITPEKFTAIMGEIDECGDTEQRHVEADELMCRVLSSLGYKDGVKIFEEMNLWYA